MQILISGKFSADVSNSGRIAANRLRDLVQAADIGDVAASLDSMIFFPVVLSDDLGIATKSHRSQSRKEKTEFVNVEIDHGRWVSVGPDVQFEMMFDALTCALLK